MTAALRIEIFPDDLDEAVDFYTRVLGFALTRDERLEESAYVALQLGDVLVGAARRAPVDVAARRPPTGVELVLEVDDLDGARRRVLEAAWPIDEDLQERPWGLRDFRLVDPCGHYWRLTEHSG
ncbi:MULTISPECIES: VOC family protein [Microbacterium]|uniref:VOC family protein n=1 Tax=Microbacterium TaxID=33882 RepID=UPI001469A0A4|nr:MULTISPECIES: VOC family protein [Microbacterium]